MYNLLSTKSIKGFLDLLVLIATPVLDQIACDWNKTEGNKLYCKYYRKLIWNYIHKKLSGTARYKVRLLSICTWKSIYFFKVPTYLLIYLFISLLVYFTAATRPSQINKGISREEKEGIRHEQVMKRLCETMFLIC